MNLDNFAINVFNDKLMKERLPSNVYKEYHLNKNLSKESLNIITNEIRKWAIENNVTHYTHYFSPLRNIMAEKHDSFICSNNLEFSNENLIKGEADASSFPSGGLRSTFEARGLTSFDISSFCFIKNKVLYIPTLFKSFNNQSLDNKTPLLKSCDVLSKYCVELLNLLGIKDVNNVNSYVGAEQEYFLIDKKYYELRDDLKLAGRTLFGSLNFENTFSNYYTNIDNKVLKFMQEVDETLYSYGILSKTRHNESALCQHELVCVYDKVTTTFDNNQLVMQTLKDVANKHNLKCLLHEKPFKELNGSGKHNNWSLCTNKNINLFSLENDLVFLSFLACLIKGIDEYSDLLRLSIASYSNDFRLGGNEAPPSIISIYLGEELTSIIDKIINDENYVLPKHINEDRNRTSPIAFNGNKFEFRGVGSNQSIAFINTILNAILTYEVKEMIKLINSGMNPLEIIKLFFKKHKRIIFNDDGYSTFWIKEANERGLNNKKSSIEAIFALKDKNQTEILSELNILNEKEINARFNILIDEYFKMLFLESNTSLNMVKTQILPSCIKYLNDITLTFNNLKLLNVNNNFLYQETKNISSLIDLANEKYINLLNNVEKHKISNKYTYENAIIIKDNILSSMNELRSVIDKLETLINKEYWPIPSYKDMLIK